MATKQDLGDWIVDALREAGGAATLVEVSRRIWQAHEPELRDSGDLFFTWQYDVRWAAHRLRRSHVIRSVQVSPTGVWELS